MLPLRPDCAQRKHTSCYISFIYRTIYASIKSGDSNARLAACFRCAPFVLNASTLRATFHLFYRTIYASIKCGDSNARLAACFRCAPFVLNASTLRATFHLFYRTIYASIKCGKINETPSQVRVFALAGAIGIEPTQWESEAQVLPLHQAPSRTLLYITAHGFAIDFD